MLFVLPRITLFWWTHYMYQPYMGDITILLSCSASMFFSGSFKPLISDIKFSNKLLFLRKMSGSYYPNLIKLCMWYFYTEDMCLLSGHFARMIFQGVHAFWMKIGFFVWSQILRIQILQNLLYLHHPYWVVLQVLSNPCHDLILLIFHTHIMKYCLIFFFPYSEFTHILTKRIIRGHQSV